nr:immunoglobulin light chain junction region [Macaca mulatta]MOX50162.1 immunoglobulin light chain junction region [Macaca mulatta]
CGQSAHLPLTF